MRFGLGCLEVWGFGDVRRLFIFFCGMWGLMGGLGVFCWWDLYSGIVFWGV